MASDIDPKIVKTSQELLTKIVKKPVITEKLVKRPPFRFLHDLITSIIKSHGFLKDLYKDNEMVAENVKEKDTKIAFLQKAIDATGFVVGDVINVKPSKIVAGLEADKTNEWLQIMAKAIIDKKSSSDAVQRVLSGEKPTKRNTTSNTTNSSNNNKKKALNENTKTSNNKNAKTKKETKETNFEQNIQIIKESKESKEVIEAKDRASPLLSANNGTDHSLEQSKQELPSDTLNGNASKPGSASENSPKSDNRDDTNDQYLHKEKEPIPNSLANNDSNQMVEQKPEVDEPKTVRPKTGAKPTLTSNISQNSVSESVSRSVRPPTRHDRTARTARPSSSRPAPPRVVPKTNEDNKIFEAELEEKMRLLNAKPVENLITENLTNDEDLDFIVTNDLKTEDLHSNERLELNGISEQKGSLVKQLVETKKELEGNQSSDAPNDDKKPVRQTNRDIEKLRQTIQSLSQTANPLGKVLDYLQEDIDSMLSELKSWQEEYKRNVQSLEKSQNSTFAELEPYRQELNVLDTSIRDEMERISLTKANIIRNEEKIQKMVQMVNRI